MSRFRLFRVHGSAATRSYRQEQTYDQHSRPFQSLDLVFAAGDEHAISGTQARKVGVRYVYTSQGHQSAIVNAQLTSDVYYEVQATNGRGQITQDRRGATAALQRNLSFDLKTGRLIGIESGQLGALQDLDYGRTQGNAQSSYDVLGNLLHREDRRTGLKESFSYDALSRLRSTTRTQNGNPLGTQWFHYDQLGNFINKGGSEFLTGGLSYRNGNYSGITHSCTRSSVGPHMVTRVSGASSETRYCYDANGNQVSAGDGNPNSSAPGQRLISYAVHDKPLTITTTGNSGVRSSYAYGPGREIIKRVDAGAPGSSTPNVVTSEVDYIGGVEVHYLPDEGSVTQRREYRRHLANYLVITLKSQRNSGVLARSSTRIYRFEEKLGSIDVLADSQGQVVQRMSFDVWGERRAEGDWSALSLAQIIAFNTDVTRKGYTGHEQVDQANLIHMGGRIYDPHIGRFLSADPLIQAPHLSQSYNRYSYVLNNPMNYVDPSGYSWISDNWRSIAAIAVAWAVPQLLPQLVPGIQAATVKIVAGMAAGAVQSGTLKGALIGGFSAGLFHGIGAHFDKLAAANKGASGLINELKLGQYAQKIAAHAAAGGVMSVLQGGKFGHGFASAGFGEAVSPLVILSASSPSGEFLIGVVIGGTASELAGGKFSNGAVTAAFQWAFNHAKTEESRALELPGGVEFNYTSVGPAGFHSVVGSYLTSIAETESGNQLLTALATSDGTFYIVYRRGAPIAQGSPFHSDTTIYFDPNYAETIQTNIGPMQSQPKYMLAHELHHAWKNSLNCFFRSCDRSLILPGPEPRGLDPTEAWAVRYTNVIRVQSGEPYIRTHYNQHKVVD